MKLTTIILIIILSSCSNRNNDNLYSTEFLRYFKDGSIVLKKDSLLFPNESGIEPVLIPTYLSLNSEYVFADSQNTELLIKRVNYTDLEFSFKMENYSEKGKASLPPQFYLGAESIEFDRNGYWLDYYNIDNYKELCISSIGIIYESYDSEADIEMMAYLTFSTNCTKASGRNSLILKLR